MKLQWSLGKPISSDFSGLLTNYVPEENVKLVGLKVDSLRTDATATKVPEPSTMLAIGVLAIGSNAKKWGKLFLLRARTVNQTSRLVSGYGK